jgi:nitrate/nitrite-specific signal transduction histidine kinase
MAGDDPKHPYVERVRAITRAYIEELLADNAQLRGQVDDLLARLARREADSRRFEDRFVEIEQQNANLAALYAASYQLHASLARAEVLATIQEIVVNLVGSEELAILRVGSDGLETLCVLGVSTERAASLRANRGLCVRALSTGLPAALAQPDEDGLTACIPLMVEGRVIGLVAIFALLPQKPALQPVDMELFGLIGHHAASALYCAELHARGEDPAC